MCQRFTFQKKKEVYFGLIGLTLKKLELYSAVLLEIQKEKREAPRSVTKLAKDADYLSLSNLSLG